MLNRSADELVGALDALGVPFVVGGERIIPAPALTSAQLLAGLAEQSDARLRLALVALLLRRPDLADAVPEAVTHLTEPARTSLKLYYTAAVLLQQKHASELGRLLEVWQRLPDLFSVQLGVLATGSVEARLQALAEQHRAWSGLAANWAVTYEHAAKRLIQRLTLEMQWAT